MSDSEQDKSEGRQVSFHMVKGTGYQTYHADGAIGGITPQGKVFASFYVERGAIPQTIYHELDDQGRVGSEIGTEGKSGIVREMTCGVILDIRTARGLKDWLEKLLEDQEQK